MKALVCCITVILFSLQAQAQECVILLHGLARSSSSMEKLQSRLNGAGYKTVNYGYPSTQQPIEILAEKAIAEALQ